jgi:hypothetical protein
VATIEDRKQAQRGHVRTLLRLIDKGEISSIGDDHWYVYDDTVPQGYRLTDQVENLIVRGLARPKGYYEIHLTEAGTAKLAELAEGSDR